MSDTQDAPPPKPAPAPRRYALDVDLRPPPAAPKEEAKFEWTPRRLVVLTLLALFFLACVFAAVELDGHPVATVLAFFPQVGIVGGVVVSVLGTGAHVDPSAWSKQAATSLSAFAERHTVIASIVIAIATALVAKIGFSMHPIDVQCPSGFRLRYGVVQDEIACDVSNEQVFAPFGVDLALASAWCVPPDGHGGWSALHRYDANFVPGAGDAAHHSEVTCYEDGGNIIHPDPSTRPLRYIEYGYRAVDVPAATAPCAHLPVGLYDYVASQHICTRMGAITLLDSLFETAYANGIVELTHADPNHEPSYAPGVDVDLTVDQRRDRWNALGLLVSAECSGHCDFSEPDAGRIAMITDAGVIGEAGADADAGAPTRTCTPPAIGPTGLMRFQFHNPRGCAGDYGDLALHVNDVDASADISIGVSHRFFGRHRCVPRAARRDGFIHVLVAGEELVFGVTTDEEPALVLIERFSDEQNSAADRICGAAP